MLIQRCFHKTMLLILSWIIQTIELARMFLAVFTVVFVVRLAIILILFGALWLWLNRTQLTELHASQWRYNALASEVHALEKQKSALEREHARLESKGFIIEKAAREQFNLARPGETIIMIENEVTSAAQANK